MARRQGSAQRGQAAVEAALTLPLTVFVFLGVLQLFLLSHGRVAAQVAAYRATRVGSTNHGHCGRMVHAALLSVLPAVESFMGGTGSAGDKVAAAFSRVRTNAYAAAYSDGGEASRYTSAVVWVARERPLAAEVQAMGAQDRDFDDDRAPMRLETRLVFWFPLKIPFANWVLSRAWLAQYGLGDYSAQNPLLPARQARWSAGGGQRLDGAIASEMRARALRGELVFPIHASWTMRMMTPAKAANFQHQNCAPTPEAL